MDKRWAIWIDIEGFSVRYEESSSAGKDWALQGLQELTTAIISVGRNAFPGTSELNFGDRIFAHQFGDGFVIVSGYEEVCPERCISIAICLMRHMALKGYCTKVGVARGDMIGINGFLPQSLEFNQCGTASLGAGHMTTTSVIGTALTKSYKLANCVSGALLVVNRVDFSNLPKTYILHSSESLAFVDWRSDEFGLARRISQKAELNYGRRSELVDRFDQYVKENPKLTDEWKSNSRRSYPFQCDNS